MNTIKTKKAPLLTALQELTAEGLALVQSLEDDPSVPVGAELVVRHMERWNEETDQVFMVLMTQTRPWLNWILQSDFSPSALYCHVSSFLKIPKSAAIDWQALAVCLLTMYSLWLAKQAPSDWEGVEVWLSVEGK
jgi:hypothetical protein